MCIFFFIRFATAEIQNETLSRCPWNITSHLFYPRRFYKLHDIILKQSCSDAHTQHSTETNMLKILRQLIIIFHSEFANAVQWKFVYNMKSELNIAYFNLFANEDKQKNGFQFIYGNKCDFKFLAMGKYFCSIHLSSWNNVENILNDPQWTLRFTFVRCGKIYTYSITNTRMWSLQLLLLNDKWQFSVWEISNTIIFLFSRSPRAHLL